jgi:hypothetical protein
MWWCVLALTVASSVAVAAEPEPAATPRTMTLSFAGEAGCATDEQREQLLAGLRLRLPELAIERLADAARAPPEALVWGVDASGRCVLTLATVDGPARIELGRQSTEAEIRAAVVRVAWWLELRERHAQARLLPPEPAKPPVPGPRPSTKPTPVFFFSVQLGPSWYPTPANVSAVLRVCAFLPLTERLQLGLEGRLATELGVYPPLDVDAYDRSLGLLARYEAPLGRAATLGVSFGLRYAFLETDTDLVADVAAASTASNLSLASGIGASWQVVEALRLRADLLAGVAVRSRELEAKGSVFAGDLGVLALELLLGFELSL